MKNKIYKKRKKNNIGLKGQKNFVHLIEKNKIPKNSRISTNEKNLSVRILAKIATQGVVCAIVFMLFFSTKNNQSTIIINIHETVKKYLNYNIDFGNIYKKISEIAANFIPEKLKEADDGESEDDINQNEEDTEEITEEIEYD